MPAPKLLASQLPRGKPESGLSHSELLRLLHYDPETGIWKWLVRIGPRAKLNSPLRPNHPDGYVLIGIRGKQYFSANLAWFYMTGKWPSGMIDHKNLARADDRWENLREGTRAQNAANSRIQKGTQSGLKGVQKREGRRWQARIGTGSNRVNLGTFDCPAAASFAYQIAAHIRYGEFARVR